MNIKQPRGLIVTLDLSNDAFAAPVETEVARILFHLSQQINSNGLSDYRLFDLNGNSVGHCRLTHS